MTIKRAGLILLFDGEVTAKTIRSPTSIAWLISWLRALPRSRLPSLPTSGCGSL